MPKRTSFLNLIYDWYEALLRIEYERYIFKVIGTIVMAIVLFVWLMMFMMVAISVGAGLMRIIS
jgi:hypothetical protein